MSIERATVALAWMAGVLLGVGLGVGPSSGWVQSVAGGILMLVVAFGFVPMFKESKDER